MKRSLARLLTVAVAAVTALLLFTGAAFAHYCSNASKPAGNGGAGVVFADVSSGDFELVPELTTVRLNAQGNIVGGGFMDLHVDFDGDGNADLVIPDVFAHAGLPPKALLAAGCGRGVETYVPFFEEACPLPT